MHKSYIFAQETARDIISIKIIFDKNIQLSKNLIILISQYQIVKSFRNLAYGIKTLYFQIF